MHIYNSWKSLKSKHKNIVLGLGNFDGVHIGHQKLIYDLVAMAKELSGTPAVFTFHPHPLAVLKPDNCPPQLLSQGYKQKIFARLGVEVLLTVPFNLKLAGLAPEDFVRTVLTEEIGARGVVVGYNYTFGHRGRGTPELLKDLSKTYGYALQVVQPVMVEGQTVSSTLIRHLIKSGDVSEAAKFLGYYPFAEGEVVTGEQRGRTLGFPTANLDIDQELLAPANGVYSAKIYHNGDTYFGLANIGVKPTFYGKKRNIEVHLLDFCEDLYGKQIKVSFTRRIRGEKKFATPSDLIKQIEMDINEARTEWLKARE
ncbi:bifunctional riboflavin kinase/FAD synthetase [Pelotomaculum propionicicum]|uniref:bifunctional riboflavin kinase/FAD synthetase n=1 Tax=Pelotomaculum propionicicum TaxID=258475 RepID=UPI003B7E136C